MNEQGGSRRCHSYFVAEKKIHKTIEILIVLVFLRGNNWLLLLHCDRILLSIRVSIFQVLIFMSGLKKKKTDKNLCCYQLWNIMSMNLHQ